MSKWKILNISFILNNFLQFCFRDSSSDQILAVVDWGQSLSFYNIAGKQVSISCKFYLLYISYDNVEKGFLGTENKNLEKGNLF